jgi:hypothetical protein
MSNEFVDVVNKYVCGCSFNDLENHCRQKGYIEMDKDLYLGHENTVFWVTHYQELADAFPVIQRECEVVGTSPMTYAMDDCGKMMPLPVASKTPPKDGYKTPHWLPVVFNKK